VNAAAQKLNVIEHGDSESFRSLGIIARNIVENGFQVD
jgi:hypothetical protein